MPQIYFPSNQISVTDLLKKPVRVYDVMEPTIASNCYHIIDELALVPQPSPNSSDCLELGRLEQHFGENCGLILRTTTEAEDLCSNLCDCREGCA